MFWDFDWGINCGNSTAYWLVGLELAGVSVHFLSLGYYIWFDFNCPSLYVALRIGVAFFACLAGMYRAD